ncbi:hypothetical protein BGZ97_001913 [Linnemannia gamsii]|uniref:Uncharacterized protein n=1 Tax=Linnemannia gamsii TaxID=64522 RepID=A0A9P6QY59_9FUNG|nr:hypothetical protein BGZ97_001913 [Linnemannia gamsii]
MGSIVSMPVLPEDNYASQSNVGTLDSIGVAIVWLALLRWIVLHLFGDDISILFCLPNPKRRGTGTHPALLHLVFFIASPIYTIVQAANCRDQLMKLNITTMVFMLIYEHIFSSTKDSLTFNFVCRCRGITLLHLIVISAGAVAVTEGVQWREFGAVVFLLASLLAIKLYQHKEIQGDKLWLIGPAVLMFTFLYPIFLAVFVTLLVNNHGQWTPRPSTVVEYIMLITRGIAGFGGIDVLGAIGSKIYLFIVPEVEVRPIVRPGFNWYRIRIDPTPGGDEEDGVYRSEV